MHLGFCLGLRSKKEENSGEVEQWRSKEAKKQKKSKEAEKQAKEEKQKSKKAEKQNSGEAKKHKSRSRERQKSKKQRNRKAKKPGNRNPKKHAQNGKNIFPQEIALLLNMDAPPLWQLIIINQEPLPKIAITVLDRWRVLSTTCMISFACR